MQPNDLHHTICQQVDHMKPDHLMPIDDVRMEVIDRVTLRIYVREDEWQWRSTDVRYHEGRDTYVVTKDGTVHDDVYCDQLGALVFGEHAKPWTQGFGHLEDGDGNIIAEF